MDALEPRVIEIGVAIMSTFVEPGAAKSAAAELSGILKGAALGTGGD